MKIRHLNSLRVKAFTQTCYANKYTKISLFFLSYALLSFQIPVSDNESKSSNTIR